MNSLYQDQKGICRECGATIVTGPPYTLCYSWLPNYSILEADHPIICIACFHNDNDVKDLLDASRRAKLSKMQKQEEKSKKRGKYIDKILNRVDYKNPD